MESIVKIYRFFYLLLGVLFLQDRKFVGFDDVWKVRNEYILSEYYYLLFFGIFF